MTDHDSTDERSAEPPRPTTARLRLERAVADEVAALAAALDLAMLEADRQLSENAVDDAVRTLEQHRRRVADTEEAIQRVVRDAMVEREAELVVAAALEHHEPSPGEAEPTPADPEPVEAPSLPTRLLGRFPAAVAAAVAGLVAFTAMVAGPRDARLDPIAADRPSEITPEQDDDRSMLRMGPTATAGSTSERQPIGAASAPGARAPAESSTGGSTTVADIAELVDRVLAEATSNVFEEVARSPLLADVEGDDLTAALELLEQRLSEQQDEQPSDEPTDVESPSSTEPSASPSEESSDGGPFDGVASKD